MTKPKISVIIPIYNTGKYLEETLVSILNQTMIDEIEVLMIDDGSTDDSKYIIERYALDYDNFYAFHKENEGQGIARNYGLDIAKGEFIHFMDSDDYVSFDAYEKLYSLAVSNNYDFVVGNVLRFGRYNLWEHQIFKKSFKGLNGNHEFKNINDYPNLVWDTIVPNALYKKEFLDKNNIRFPNKNIFFEDLLVSIETYVKSDRFIFLDEIFYYWRLRHDLSSVTQSNSSIKNFRDRLEILRTIKRLFKSDLSSETLKKLYEKWLVHDLKMYIKHINDYGPQYHDELIDGVMSIIEDIPHDVREALPSYLKLIYRMIENRDIDSLLYFVPLDEILKKNPSFKLNLNEDYLELIDFERDGAKEEFTASVEKIENDENNLYVEFKWNINYLDDIRPDIKPTLLADNGQEYSLDVRENKIVLPFELLKDKKYSKIKMVCSNESFKKESLLENYSRDNVNFDDVNLEIGIGVNNILYINSRDVNPEEIIIDEISFDGEDFIFVGCTEFEINEMTIENVINFEKFTYPVDINNHNFIFKIPYCDLIKFPVKKWELKGDYLIKLPKAFRFFRNYDELLFENRRNIILIEDNIYDCLERLNELNDNFNTATKKNNKLSRKIQKQKDKNAKLKEKNSKLKVKNNKLKEKNSKLKAKNNKLKEKNIKLNEKNNRLNETIDEYKSRKIIRIADKFK